MLGGPAPAAGVAGGGGERVPAKAEVVNSCAARWGE